MKKLTTNLFIRKAKSIFGDEFDYSKSNYTGALSKIIITCPKHGDFEKLPYSFFRSGCYGCYLDRLKEKSLTPLERKNRKKEQNKKYRLNNLEKDKRNHKKYYKNNKEEILKKRKLYNIKHKEEIKLRQKQYNLKHKEEMKSKKKEYALNHREHLKEKKKEYQLIHKEQIRERRRKYYIKNRDRIREKVKNYQLKRDKTQYRKYYRKYHLERRKKDINFMLRHRIRNRIFMALKGGYKSAKTMDLLGCSIDQLKEHLNLTAIKNGYKNFDINNFNGKQWHIDHVIPCCAFDLSDPLQQKECFNYKNLQILSAKDNILKNRKIG